MPKMGHICRGYGLSALALWYTMYLVLHAYTPGHDIGKLLALRISNPVKILIIVSYHIGSLVTDTIPERFRRHPFEWESHFALFLVPTVQVLCQAKISYQNGLCVADPLYGERMINNEFSKKAKVTKKHNHVEDNT